jgi:hypothetical protein
VRAFGVGVLLATQNPIDLDYKALSNAGTWVVGKLQTERDKARLLDGLESVEAEHGKQNTRAELEKKIASLGNRLFLLHDIHRGEDVVFQSRWALSFLRGPMTREQVGRLMKPVKEQAERAESAPMAIPLCSWCFTEVQPGADRCPNPACGKVPWGKAQARVEDKAFREALMRAASPPAAASAGGQPPVLPPDVRQFYLQPAGGNAAAEHRPRVLGIGEVTFVVDKRAGKEHVRPVRLLAAPPAPGCPVDWGRAEAFAGDFAAAPPAGGRWADVPETLDTGRKLKALEKAFAEHLYSTQKLSLWENRPLGLVSEPGEAEAAFRERCRAAAKREAEQALALEKAKYRPRFESLDMKLPEEQKPKGGSWLSWILPSAPAETGDPKLEEKRRRLRADYEGKVAEIAEKWRRAGEEAAPVQLKPRKADVRVTHFGIGWAAGA